MCGIVKDREKAEPGSKGGWRNEIQLLNPNQNNPKVKLEWKNQAKT